MIIKGKSASHGRYLKTYLVSKRDNDIDPEVFRIRGTATPDNYDLSANEIILSGLLSRGDKNVYHGIINPSINERPLTDEEWHISIDKLLSGLGYENQKHIGIKHVKDGREHMHLMIDRYSYDLEKLLPDNHNYRTHQNVATELEEEFNHDLTPRKRDYKRLSHHKEILTDLWNNTADGKEFIEQAEAVGYHIGKGLEKRPYKVVTADGKSLDLVRQLQGIKTAEVFERLRYEELKTEAEALKQVTAEKKIASDLAEKEFLRNLEDEQFLSQQEDREKEKKQVAQLEAEMAAATALEDQEVKHSKPKKPMAEQEEWDRLAMSVTHRTEYEKAQRNDEYIQLHLALEKQYEEEKFRLGDTQAVKAQHDRRVKQLAEYMDAAKQVDEKRFQKYWDQLSGGDYKEPSLDEEKDRRIEQAEKTVMAMQEIANGREIPPAQITALQDAYGKDIIEQIKIKRQMELNKQQETELTEKEREKLERERKILEYEERKRREREAFLNGHKENSRDMTRGFDR